jgi:hypothetical protein
LLKFPCFRDKTIELIIFFQSFRTHPPETRDRWLHAGPKGELDTGVVFFFFSTLEILFFSRYDPPILQFFFRSFRAGTPDPREVWFHDVPRYEVDSGASSSPGWGFRLLVFANSRTFIFS